jgi:hypothetical protein
MKNMKDEEEKKKNRKKALIILFTLMVAIFGSGFLFAYFTDLINTAGNTFTTDSLTLTVGGPTTPAHIQIGGDGTLKPGSAGTAVSWAMVNAGTLAGNLSIAVGTITNNENTANHAEIADGDSPTSTTGELGQNLKVAFWVDQGDAGWSSGDYYLKSDGTKVPYSGGTSLPADAYDILDNYGGDTFSYVNTNTVGGATIGTFKVMYDLPWAATSNICQTDSCVFDLVFTLIQTPP